MSRFIKLSNIVLNVAHINKIDIGKNKYYINLLNNSPSGFYIFMFGVISSEYSNYIVCANKNPSDYKVVTEWLNKLENSNNQ